MYCKHCGKVIADDSKFCRYCGTNLVDVSLAEESSNVSQSNETKAETVEPSNDEVIEIASDNTEQSVSTEPIVEKETIVEEKSEPIKNRELPLVRRFFGSLIDKFFVLLIAVLGYIACKPYAGTGDIGTFIGLMNAKPSNYEYIDRIDIDNYGKIYPGIDIEFQMKAREESDVPYIGHTKDFDMRMCSIFIIVNVIYFILFELTLRSSPGKAILGGKLLDNASNKLSLWRVPLRSIILGALAFLCVLLFRYGCDLSYYTVTAFFFIIMDFSLFFNKRSFIDICTGTRYADVITKKDLKGKYGEPDILVKKKQLKNK